MELPKIRSFQKSVVVKKQDWSTKKKGEIYKKKKWILPKKMILRYAIYDRHGIHVSEDFYTIKMKLFEKIFPDGMYPYILTERSLRDEIEPWWVNVLNEHPFKMAYWVYIIYGKHFIFAVLGTIGCFCLLFFQLNRFIFPKKKKRKKA